MNTNDLLTVFRAEVPLPDEATAQRIYARVTLTSRGLPRRRLVLALVAVAIAGAVVTGLTAIHSGTAKPAPRDRAFLPLTNFRLTRSGQMVTSIAITFTDAHFTDATLALEVIGRDGQVVFEERVPMTNTGSTVPETAVSTWSGTLSPSDWAGGCQNALYTLRFAVYPTGLSLDDPFDSPETDRSSGYGFNCAGS